MDRKAVVFMVFLGIAGAAAAREPTWLTQKELGKALQKYQHLKRLQAPFTQVKSIKEMDIKLKSTGFMTLIRPDTVIWEVVTPDRLVITISDAEVTLESGPKNNPKKMHFKNSKGGTSLSSGPWSQLTAWMSLDAQKLFENYRVQQNGKDSFTFFPKNESALIQHMKMRLGSDGFVRTLHLLERSGDEMSMEFGASTSNLKTQ